MPNCVLIFAQHRVKSDEIRDFRRDGDKRAFFGPTLTSRAVAPGANPTDLRRSFAYRLGRGQTHLLYACAKVRRAISPAQTALAYASAGPFPASWPFVPCHRSRI